MTSLTQRVLRGSGWIAASTLSLALAQVFQLVTLARLLGPADYGVFAILMMLIGFLEILMISGIANAIIQRDNVTSNELSSLHWLNTIIGVLLGIALFFSASAISQFFGTPAATAPIMVLSLAALVNSQSHVPRASLEKDLRFRPVALIEFSAGLTSVGAVVLGAALFGLMGVAFGLLFGFLVRSVLFFLVARSTAEIRFHFSFAETLRFLSFGVYQLLNAVIGFLDGNMAGLVIGKSLGTRDLGAYSLSYNTSVNIPGRINPIVTRVMFPALSRVKEDLQKFSRASLHLITFTGLVNAPIMLSIAVTAPSLVPLAFGDQWDWVYPIVQIMALVGLTRSMGNPMGPILMARDKQRLGFIINIFKTAASLLILLVFVTNWGLYGAAFALLASGVLTLTINQFLLRYLLGASSWKILWSHLVPLLIGIPSLLLGYWLHGALDGAVPALLQIALGWLAIGVSYLGLAWVTRVPVLREISQQFRRPRP